MSTNGELPSHYTELCSELERLITQRGDGMNEALHSMDANEQSRSRIADKYGVTVAEVSRFVAWKLADIGVRS